MHEQLKIAVGIEKASCHSCAYRGDEPVDDYYSVPVCNKHEHYSYLKPFPFKTEQKCWTPNFWHSKFTNLIDGEGSSESVTEAIRVFVSARDRSAT